MMTILVKFLSTPVPMGADVEIIFSLAKAVLCPKRLSDAQFQILVFFKGNQ